MKIIFRKDAPHAEEFAAWLRYLGNDARVGRGRETYVNNMKYEPGKLRTKVLGYLWNVFCGSRLLYKAQSVHNDRLIYLRGKLK